MQKARRHTVAGAPTACKRTVSGSLSLPRAGLFGVLPTFPSRYWSTIGLPEVFSLAGWSPLIRTGFHVPRPTQVPAMTSARRPYGGVTLCAHTFQNVPVGADVNVAGPTTPPCP